MELLFPAVLLFLLPFLVPLGFVLFFVAAGAAILGFSLIGDSDTRGKGIAALILAVVLLVLTHLTSDMSVVTVILNLWHRLRNYFH